MSLFKERQASAKKVIQLQNEVLSLKKQLESFSSKEDCEDCDKLREQIESILKQQTDEKLSFQQELVALKADLKKLRSENTRLKNKLNKESKEESKDV